MYTVHLAEIQTFPDSWLIPSYHCRSGLQTSPMIAIITRLLCQGDSHFSFPEVSYCIILYIFALFHWSYYYCYLKFTKIYSRELKICRRRRVVTLTHSSGIIMKMLAIIVGLAMPYSLRFPQDRWRHVWWAGSANISYDCRYRGREYTCNINFSSIFSL